MLKLMIDEEERLGAVLMDWWDGRGAARVLCRDHNACLLERATGKGRLPEMACSGNDGEAVRILCSVAEQLHTPQAQPPPNLVPLSRWFRDLELAAATHGGVLASCSAAERHRMPVSFLTAEQERRYGRYAGEPSTDQLARHYHLDDADRELATAKRWDYMRLGFAVQLGTVRFLGTFLDDPVDVPAGVAGDLARQLGVADPSCLALYREGRVRWQHAREIRAGFGYREFTDPAMRFRLTCWLYALCWTGTDRPSVLFDRATAWLVTEKVLLPGATALERLIARIRGRAARRLWRSLSRDVTHEQRARLDALLLAGEGGRPSPLDRLRDGPYLRSGAELSRAVERLDEVRLLALGLPTIAQVPPGRVTALARFATIAKAQAVARMPLERRMATLLAFVRTLEATAQDDVLDLLDIVVTKLFSDAAKIGKRARLRTTMQQPLSCAWLAPCSWTTPLRTRRFGKQHSPSCRVMCSAQRSSRSTR